MSDNELNSKIQLLNQKQRKLFNKVQSCAKKYVQNKWRADPLEHEHFRIFLIGNAGSGKSFLMRVTYQCLTKTLPYGSTLVDKALLMAPTGVAAITTDSTTIHTAFNIPVGRFGSNLLPRSDKMKSSLKNRLSELKIIIIDEISMISNNLLFYVHLRLNEIFGSINDKPFAGISVITIGGFFQLPPVGERPVYADYKNNWKNFESLWKLFKIFELTEVMRQRGNAEFIHLMNNVRIGDTQSCDIRLLESRVIKPQSSSYPKNTLHIFAENASAKCHRNVILN